jgi:hypothetical protein
MTAARQAGKWLPLLILFAGAAGLAPQRLSAEPAVIVNPATGLAISGFDPVAYFTDKKADLGRPDLELRSEGVVWRFRNPGNREAFQREPGAYSPRFGGYDPFELAHGRPVAGHPLFWAITGERLYLFYSAENRAAFVADPGSALAQAQSKWAQVERVIAR